MIMAEPHNDRTKQVPAVDFYGDKTTWPMPELVHSEPLVERSELHDWKIRPHRHNDLTQLFMVLDGSGRARLDSHWVDLESPCLLVIPERVVHEFEWESTSSGYVLSIRSDLVSDLTERIRPLGKAFQSAHVVSTAESQDFISALFAEILSECNEQRPLRDASLESLVRVLAIWLTQKCDSQSQTPSVPDRSQRHFSRFAKLIDTHHKKQWSVADYASALGMTPSHLNSICRKLTGKSALDVIHARLLLAARRQLVYTERNIAGVAHHLGFADPSYFTRFFKRQTGITPGAYRRRSGTIEG
jgi:AraC family transcriptional activator of pobA